MRARRPVAMSLFCVLLAMTGVTAISTGAVATHGGDTRVNVGSQPGPFSHNKQNEPAIAVNPVRTNILAAGANDNIDMEHCNAGEDNTCPFSDGVGGSGIYFSFDSGHSWVQPTYTGLTARGCTGQVGDTDPECTPTTGPIGTLPNYAENGLVSDGDPALAFGPVPRNGRFSWENGQRLYYANLTSKRTGSKAFLGPEAIAVSHVDDLAAAAAGDESAWSDPVIASKQNAAKFSDKEQIWADNAASSRFFGNVYVCYAAFRGNGNGFGNQPLSVLTSRDGGSTWTERQVTPAANNINTAQGFGRSGCTVRTDSRGRVYVFTYQFAFDPAAAALGHIQMITSNDGGATWARPVTVASAYDTCDYIELSIFRCVMDGVGGARSDLSPAPSVDIANGAPTGADATNRIVMSWVDGEQLNNEHVRFSTSTDFGASWSTARNIEIAGDRGYYSAPAISPHGRDVYVVYNAFLEPFKSSAVGAANDRPLVGVVLHADVTAGGVGAFTQLHRGQPGDARGSSQNDLAAEFLGDYVYAAATRTYGAAVWVDARNAASCAAVDAYRQELHDEAVATGEQTAEAEEPGGGEDGESEHEEEGPEAPDVQQVCPFAFGNSDIYGGSWADPTP